MERLTILNTLTFDINKFLLIIPWRKHWQKSMKHQYRQIQMRRNLTFFCSSSKPYLNFESFKSHTLLQQVFWKFDCHHNSLYASNFHGVDGVPCVAAQKETTYVMEWRCSSGFNGDALAVYLGDFSRQTASASRLKPRKTAPLHDLCCLLLSGDTRNAIYAVKVTGV